MDEVTELVAGEVVEAQGEGFPEGAGVADGGARPVQRLGRVDGGAGGEGHVPEAEGGRVGGEGFLVARAGGLEDGEGVGLFVCLGGALDQSEQGSGDAGFGPVLGLGPGQQLGGGRADRAAGIGGPVGQEVDQGGEERLAVAREHGGVAGLDDGGGGPLGEGEGEAGIVGAEEVGEVEQGVDGVVRAEALHEVGDGDRRDPGQGGRVGG